METANIEIIGTQVLVKKLHLLQSKVKEGKIPFLLASDLKVLIVKRLKSGLGLTNAFDDYSTTPYYRDKQLRPFGKGGRRTTKKGKPMNTIFYEGGYKEFVGATKVTQKVTLMASGAMLRDLQAKVINSNTAQLIFNQQEQAQKALQLTRIKGQWLGANKIMQNKLSENFKKIMNNLVRKLGLA